MSSRAWSTNDYLTHRLNPELGVGRVTAVQGRTLLVDFPSAKTRLRLAAEADALVRIDLQPGHPVRVVGSREETTVAERFADGRLRLANGLTARTDEVWPLRLEPSLLGRLASGDVDRAHDFATRLDMLRLLSLREAHGLGSFLGGRVRLFPHQLYVAERAVRTDPVRWLLADEVGLGKTIEAALILNHLVHTRRVERCLVVAPEALTVQWLGELWRKYHQVFTLLDAARLSDVARDFGGTFNPFDVHRRAVIALETLVERPELTAQAVTAGIDLLIVDEAQRLRRSPGHPGEPAWRAVAPIAALGRHVLLLSATPLEDDAHGFFRLLQLLRPEEFPEDEGFEERLARREPLPPCTSSTRRSDIGGLPPRVGIPIDMAAGAGDAHARDLEDRVRRMPAAHALARRQTIDRLRRALSSGAALAATLGPADTALKAQAQEMDALDARLEWLAAQAPAWRRAGEKTLVFVAHRETLELIRTSLSHRVQLATGVFHEELNTARRDTEVARFREPDGPSLLVSTECGGEGRNFEFCRRIVLFDLPWKPTVVEQRIGRLDRIGRRIPVEIVYFRPAGGIGADVVRLFEALGLFREPLAGLEPQLAHIERSLEELALDPAGSLTDASLERLIADASEARTRVREAAWQQLHRDPYRAGMAPGILGRVPFELDALTERVVVSASARLGFGVERMRGRSKFAIELGNEALVDSLPGVPGGSSFVGSFDREEAVQDESIDYFASGHPLVEGLLVSLDDSQEGRVAYIEVSGHDRNAGLVAIYREGLLFDVVALDADGKLHPEWCASLRHGRARVSPVRSEQGRRIDWAAVVRRAGARLEPARRPYAVAGVVVVSGTA
jgi:ATP-dependent helicase HepA